MIIEITKEDIENAPICPIAARLRRQLDVPFTVGTDNLILRPKNRDACTIRWPKAITEWIQRSDNGLAVEPVKFSMPI